ncbi:MAG: hypothetical protein HFH85_16090 [Lachnospiraceae bacterium]|jgi:hypothetical protein|nr:hypothetical protein [Lachnospiraceae bacterium]
MALKIMGKKYYDFTNTEKQRFTGLKLHCIQEFPSPTEGYLVEIVSIGSSKAIYTQVDSFPYGTIITPVYNRYGKIEDVILKSLPGDEATAGAQKAK